MFLWFGRRCWSACSPRSIDVGRFLQSLYARLFSSGAAKPVVYPETFSLDKVADGLVAIEQRKTWGKVIAHVREPAQVKGKL